LARFDRNTGWPQPTTPKESHAAEVSPPAKSARFRGVGEISPSRSEVNECKRLIASAMQFSKSLQQHWEQESERKTPNYCIADEQCLKHQEVSRNEPEERVRHHHPQNGSRVTSRTRGGVSRDK